MEIIVKQEKIAATYKVFLDGELSYRAACTRLSWWSPPIDLIPVGEMKASMTIQRIPTMFKAWYKLTRKDGRVFDFRALSWWKPVYQCICGSDNYTIHGHEGRKYSIYLNDVQVARWDKNAISWFAGDNYRILANNDSDREMLISFCIAFDNLKHLNRDGLIFRWDIGNFGFGSRPNDERWQPSTSTV